MSAIIQALFAVDFLLGGGSNFFGEDDLIIAALLKLLLLIAGYGVVLAGYASRGTMLRIPRRHAAVVGLLAVWSGLSLAAVVGPLYEREISIRYVAGDLYKFLLLPATFALMCLGITTRRRFEALLRGVAVVFSLCSILYLAYFAAGALSMYTVGPIAIASPLVLPILVWTLRSSASGRVHRLAAALALAQIPVLLYYSQSLGLVLNVLAAFGLTLLFSARRSRLLVPALLITAVPIVAGLATLFPAAYETASEYVLRPHSGQQHIVVKLQGLVGRDPLSLDTLETFSGGRVSELLGLYDYLAEHPAALATGAGMGTYLQRRPTNSFRMPPATHFLESAYGEVLFRTGLFGLLAFLGLLAGFVRKSVAITKKLPGGGTAAPAAAVGILLFIGYSMGVALFPPFSLLCLLFAGMLLMDGGMAARPKLYRARFRFPAESGIPVAS